MAALFLLKDDFFYQRWWVLDYWLTNANIDEQTGRPSRPDRAGPSLARCATVSGCLGLRAWPTAQALPNGPIFVPGRPKWPDQNGVPGQPK